MLKLTKRINKIITLNQSLLASTIIGLANILLISLLVKHHYSVLLFLIIPLVFLWIYISSIAIHKTAEDKYMRIQKSTLDVIKKDLPSSFTRVTFIDSENTMVKNIFSKLDLSFWAKLDEEGIITIITKDSNGGIIREERTQNYLWFVKKFLYL